MIRGSGNKFMSTIRIDKNNANADVWYCERKDEWHWCLVWEDGGPYGTHMHNGIAPSKLKARADVVKTIIWIEDTWPSLEYFQGV